MAEKFYKTVKKEYRRGYKSADALAGAAAGVLDAEIKQLDFIHEFLNERIALERLTGLAVETDSAPEKSHK